MLPEIAESRVRVNFVRLNGYRICQCFKLKRCYYACASFRSQDEMQPIHPYVWLYVEKDEYGINNVRCPPLTTQKKTYNNLLIESRPRENQT